MIQSGSRPGKRPAGLRLFGFAVEGLGFPGADAVGGAAVPGGAASARTASAGRFRLLTALSGGGCGRCGRCGPFLCGTAAFGVCLTIRGVPGGTAASAGAAPSGLGSALLLRGVLPGVRRVPLRVIGADFGRELVPLRGRTTLGSAFPAAAAASAPGSHQYHIRLRLLRFGQSRNSLQLPAVAFDLHGGR